MTIYRNWIERILSKRLSWISRSLGKRGGRDYYEITFTDGTSKDYFIDFNNETIEEVKL